MFLFDQPFLSCLLSNSQIFSEFNLLANKNQLIEGAGHQGAVTALPGCRNAERTGLVSAAIPPSYKSTANSSLFKRQLFIVTLFYYDIVTKLISSDEVTNKKRMLTFVLTNQIGNFQLCCTASLGLFVFDL